MKYSDWCCAPNALTTGFIWNGRRLIQDASPSVRDIESYVKSFALMSRSIIRTESANRRRVGSCTMEGKLIADTASLKFASTSRQYVLNPFAFPTICERNHESVLTRRGMTAMRAL